MPIRIDGQQREILNTALREASRLNASPRERKALVEAMIVESGIRNLPGGDRDSQGVLQQRSSQGWMHSRNVTLATRDFLKAARAANKKTPGGAGSLAQAVQRSAYPGRYEQQSAQADQLLGGGQGPWMGRSASAQSAGVHSEVNPNAVVGNLLAKHRPGSSLLSSGIFKPGDVMQDVANAPPAQAQPSLGGSVTPSSGSVVIAKGADRPGVGLDKGTLGFLDKVSGVFGHTLTVGTGSNHNKMTVNGNVSDHWDGHGADMPATGKTLIRMGQAALIAAGMPAAQARKQKGGLYTLQKGKRRIQVIFNTHEGGDHTNHLHVGYR